jgi:hypothetical protein
MNYQSVHCVSSLDNTTQPPRILPRPQIPNNLAYLQHQCCFLMHTSRTVLDAVPVVLVVVDAFAAVSRSQCYQPEEPSICRSKAPGCHPASGQLLQAVHSKQLYFARQKIQPPQKFDLLLASFSRREVILDSSRTARLFDDEDVYYEDDTLPAEKCKVLQNQLER